MTQLLEGLNPAQREAVEHVDGPLLILAGPGSGKTRVVTHRIAHLLSLGVPAWQILALTFTNKAAAEMRQRVERLAPGQRVWVSTFHRFGAKMLRQYADRVGLDPNYTIYDAGDARQTLKRVVESLKIPVMGYTPDRIAAAISKAKNRLIGPEEYKPRSGNPLSEIVAAVYPAYQQRLLASSAVDFDDLLLHIARLLHDDTELRKQLDERFRYVMVDEYQDTNRAQYVLLRALSVDYPNLAATGDPDQSIYGWRGADLNNILEFEQDYPGVKVVRLEQNYRSTPAILSVADTLIAHNKRRKPKSLFTENPDGLPVRLVTYADGDDEARSVAMAMEEAVKSGRRRWSDFAVFYRVNALSRTVERVFRKRQIPFQMVRGQEFYQRREIKDVLAYCQLMNNPKDDLAFERTVNSPPRGIGSKTVGRLADYAYRHGVSLLDAARDAPQVEGVTKRTAMLVGKFVALVDTLDAYAAGPAEEAVGAVLEHSGYRKHYGDSDSEEDLNRLANIEELLTDARQFDEAMAEEEDAEANLEAYLERTWLVNETDGWDDDTDKVTLMTLHAAKGLEFPVVFLLAVEDGILPHERSAADPTQLEEERRLAFVGITRAEQELQLSHALRRDYRGQRRIAIPSSFLMELPTGVMEVAQTAPTDELGLAPDELIGDWGDAPSEEVYRHEPAEPVAAPTPTATPTVGTAAALLGSGGLAAPRVSPDAFKVGMAVEHPELGVGKVLTLSGNGKGRRAAVVFPEHGEKRFVLAFSPLRPAGRP
ncbi:ATP-dependent DNA helicase PcrA [Botrimarina colliarenosi]|uniref:DNA 3'-5' helicase n=1 Tax=Botrimarina colliarenosi TaxID=2528001 RepID=A0A5C6AD79_9BACT|nr:UvrD-helicase domain-containing protein [Botrimarina colliarenosi]TWT98012.1 ATP-dependent DNA helicase PcrA [Botrimarina colliarenosi]